MKTNEQFFDELMRQKLGDYSEAPDMELLDNIHQKKNRLIKLYGLQKMFAIICLVAISMFGLYLFLQPVQETTASNNKVIQQKNIDTRNQNSSDKNVPYFYSNTITSAASTSTESIKNEANSYKIIFDTNKSFINNSSIQKSIQPTNNIYDKIITSPKSTPSLTNKNTEAIDEKKPIIKKEETKNEETKQKEKQQAVTCKAAFDFYVSYDGKFIFTNFSDMSSTAKSEWNFGDGSTSEINSPIHIYANKGTYTVTLNIIDKENSCADLFQKTLAYGVNKSQQNNGVTLKGRALGNSEPIGNCNIKLLAFNTDKSNYQLIEKTTTSLSGEYAFSKIKNGRYIILAETNNNNFISTYWGNAINIEDALEIGVMNGDDQDLNGYDIYLSINKIIQASDNSKIPSGDSSKESSVLIFDANNNLIKTATKDAYGNINTSGLPSGKYNILNPETGSSSQITIGSQGDAGSSGEKANNSITLFPNPAVNDFKFDINSSGNGLAEVTIINSSGVTINHYSYPCTNGSNPANIDISKLAPGVYYVAVSINGTQTSSGRLIKKADDNR